MIIEILNSKEKRCVFLHIFLTIFAIIVFGVMLTSSSYMYYLYFIAGVAVFLMATILGKQVYLYVLFAITFISVSYNEFIYNMNYFNNDGLNALKLHPMTIVLVTALLLEFAMLIINKRFELSWMFLLGIAVIIVFTGLTFVKRGIYGGPIIIENYVGPILSFLYFLQIKEEIANINIKKVMRNYIIISALIGLYGFAEYILKQNLLDQLFTGTAIDAGNTVSNEGYRIRTIMGHPLNNAFIFLTAIGVVRMYRFESKLAGKLLEIFFVLIIALTGSRAFLLVSLCFFILPDMGGKNSNEILKALIIQGAAVAVVAVALLFTPIGKTVLGRFDTGGLSTEARYLLFDYMVKNIRNFKIIGLGAIDANIEIMSSINTRVIPENPWIIMFIEISYFSFIYFYFLIRAIWKAKYKLYIVILLVGLTSYNSFGVKGNLNYILYLFMIINMIVKVQSEEEARDIDVPCSLMGESKCF